MKPKVVFLTDVVTPYMVTVLTALSELVDLTVLFCSESGSRSMDWRFGKALPFRHRVIGGLTIPRDDAMDYHLSPRIVTSLVRAKPQAVICSGFSVPTLYAAIYSRTRGAALIVHSDGTSYSERGLSPAQKAARAVLLRVASAFVANSEPAAERFVELGMAPARVWRAPHSTNMQPLWHVAEERRYEQNGSVRLLAVGRLIPRKGIDKLLVALERARRRQVDIRLVLVGSGPEERRLRDLARQLGLDNVEFRGFVDQPGLPACYAESDVFVFPTLDDPYGIALLEAAAAGLPLVASPFAGATVDLVRDGECGLVADPNDADALADALVAVASDPQVRERMGRAAHRVTLMRTPEAAAAGYAEAVAAAMEDRAR
jgi:glycosyltransferase involved in cell wall biosynthesis